ncbi:hypothetical protein [Pseudoduganella umbonata]|uniref:Uncharacterized protein n=1 Tax=Pseudoduganella umbonata TaxID=864828 RepID=A0A4P8HQH5_9BURK|nr:hypothetical protein [Pseudoduganella umbonata]MBB3224209.1 hypothetical protein [Pseudoduganella umbonata]QCP11406.1 hypothetical protein FCL38_14000 [Pseudoduganella umbonata]
MSPAMPGFFFCQQLLSSTFVINFRQFLLYSKHRAGISPKKLDFLEKTLKLSAWHPLSGTTAA